MAREAECPQCGNGVLWSGNFVDVYCRVCSFVYLCWYKPLNRIGLTQKLQE